MHPCPCCGAGLRLSSSRETASCPACERRFAWVVGRGWMTPAAAEAARPRSDTRGYEVAYMVRGYLVDPRSIKDHEPTWEEMVDRIKQILGNPLLNFQDLTLVTGGDGEAVITDATGEAIARVELESPGRVRTIPLDQ